MQAPMIVGIGEILWDIFPDGPRFGGAPSNFACSVAELARDGAQVHMVSGVGDDDLGKQALASLSRHGVKTTSVQVKACPTGQVLVELDSAGVAAYRFADNCAWDHLRWNDSLRELSRQCDVVCFGTLGQRSQRSRSTIQTFVRQTREDSLRILDVNLREPFYDECVILQSLELANVLKLNDDELPILSRLCVAGGDEIEQMRHLAGRFQLRLVALTRGAGGAIIVSSDCVSDLPGQSVEVADTVGAGDAFTAAMTLGLLARRNVEAVNHYAMAAASHVCSKPGATMAFPPQLFEDGPNPTG